MVSTERVGRISFDHDAVSVTNCSRIPLLGRNGIYIVTFFIFTVLLIPTALVENLAGLLVLRFLLRWFGKMPVIKLLQSSADIYNRFAVLGNWCCRIFGYVYISQTPVLLSFLGLFRCVCVNSQSLYPCIHY
jgi:hypothetical protein